MTWIKLDDNFADHPKIAPLTHGAFRLHVAGICYCARHLTDGIIASDDIPRLIRGYRAAHLTELTDRGLWLPILTYMEIHDYLQWNPSRKDVEATRDMARQKAYKRWRTR